MSNKQKIFNKIIVGVDGSDNSLRATKKAISLSKQLKIDVVAIYVVNVTPLSNVLSPEQIYDIWKKAIEDEAVKSLDKVEEIAKKMNAEIKTMMIKGDPSEEIIKEANENDLIVVGSKGKSAIDRVIMGSVSEKVVHHSNATVIIVK